MTFNTTAPCLIPTIITGNDITELIGGGTTEGKIIYDARQAYPGFVDDRDSMIHAFKLASDGVVGPPHNGSYIFPNFANCIKLSEGVEGELGNLGTPDPEGDFVSLPPAHRPVGRQVSGIARKRIRKDR